MMVDTRLVIFLCVAFFAAPQGAVVWRSVVHDTAHHVAVAHTLDDGVDAATFDEEDFAFRSFPKTAFAAVTGNGTSGVVAVVANSALATATEQHETKAKLRQTPDPDDPDARRGPADADDDMEDDTENYFEIGPMHFDHNWDMGVQSNWEKIGFYARWISFSLVCCLLFIHIGSSCCGTPVCSRRASATTSGPP